MEEIVNTIKRRYIQERAIYTWCGIALVAVNPYQEQDVYGQSAIETYHSASHSVYLQLDPHIYALTEDAYSKLERHSRNQSIIVSGESGAGKTVSAKHAMRYLASIASSKSKLQIENRVLASNPIMEAIGNARTVRNDNSSRFGKYIQIFFDRHNRKILGGNMRTYLLEKSRVTKQQPGERNFHIFYQLLNYAYKNPSKMSHLELLTKPETDDDNNLTSPQMREFNFLAKQQPEDTHDDLKRFNESLKTLNIDQIRIDMIYKIIAGIMHGGNIKFQPLNPDENEHDQGCQIDRHNDFHFKTCCQLLGLDTQQTEKALTTKLLKTGPREVIVQPLSRLKAEYARDAMLKYIYEYLFAWLVGSINLSLESSRDKLQDENLALLKSPTKTKTILDQIEPQFIGVLDIYGFENFKTNSFEQFCINYANEVLQQQYNQHVFKLEQEEYINEGIDWTFIEYSDNQPVIDIIESKPIGILNLLDEECRMPKGSDRSWCSKLFEHLLAPGSSTSTALGNRNGSSDTAVFKKPKINYQTSFCINHYAEEVTYDVDTFLEKNRDTICDEQKELLRQSDVIKYIFEDPLLENNVGPNQPSTFNRLSTVGSQFRGSLAALIKTLNDTEPHYIRCIKPNDEKKAFEFDEDRAIQQLKACGVYETIRISNNGFPSRWLYRDFSERYCVLIYGTEIFERLTREQASEEDINNNNACHTLADVKPICDAICSIAYAPNSPYASIRTTEEQNYLDKLKKRHGDGPNAIYQFGKTKIFFRSGQVGFLERVRAQRIRGYCVTIQRYVRGWIARRSFAKRLEQRRSEENLLSIQEQESFPQTELENDEVETGIPSIQESPIDCCRNLIVEMFWLKTQPMVGVILEHEALDSIKRGQNQASMEDLISELNQFHDSISKNSVPQEIVVQAFKDIFYLICAQSLNQLLIRPDLCEFYKAMQINFNLSCLVQWVRERYVTNWRDIVGQLEPMIQAIKLLQTRKSIEDIETIEEVCHMLTPNQIIKILNMYTSSYEERITFDFMEKLESYLLEARGDSNVKQTFLKTSIKAPKDAQYFEV